MQFPTPVTMRGHILHTGVLLIKGRGEKLVIIVIITVVFCCVPYLHELEPMNALQAVNMNKNNNII